MLDQPTIQLSAADREARQRFYNELSGEYARRYKTYDRLSIQVLHNLLQVMTQTSTRCGGWLHEKGLTLPGMNVMLILRRYGAAGCPLNVLSRLLWVTRANITGLVDSLARKGFAKRVAHATDRRITLARITPAGETLLEANLPQHYANIGSSLSGLSIPEKKKLIALLTKIQKGPS